MVTIRIHGVTPADDAYDGVVRDIQQSLQLGLLGFQELEIRDGKGARPVAADSNFLPASSLKRAFRPVYRDACQSGDLPSGGMRSAILDETNVLVLRVGDELFAVRNACGESPLPLDYSTLDGTTLRCSWHSCLYDIRTGARLDRSDVPREEYLQVFPVREVDGVIQVVVGTARAGAPS